MNKQVWVYDIETCKSVFTYTALNIDTQETVQYIIHKDKNQIFDLIYHLKSCKGQIGFNNVNFDYPIIHKLLKQCDEDWIDKADYIINLAFEEAQRLISSQNSPNFNNIIAIKHNDVLIPQLDLFKIWHFNNKARATSLKSLEIAMNMSNVMDMDIDYKRDDITLDEVINQVLPYNLNDVLATYEFYKRSIDKIELRKGLRLKYKMPCLNYPDSKIGESLVLKLYCDATGMKPWEVKEMRSERLKIALNDCIFDYIKFNATEFNNLLNKLKNKVITETKGSIVESVVYKGFKYDYGTGGIHGCIKPGVYNTDDDYVIIDADVASLYPSIGILNNLYPEHLGEIFCSIYENGIVKPRLKAKKEGDMVMADGFKLSANSVYGKSNDRHSFLYDPVYTMKTTLNGQLMLTMLCEWLTDKINDLTMLQINTDGITVRIKKSDLDLYYKICKDWEDYTKLTLEYVSYNKMIIRDVNNYIAVTDKGKIKYKGAFEINKDYHKDNSFKIIPIALSDYFVKGIPVEQTIKEHRNIYDFCGRQKFVGGDYGTIHTIIGDKIVVEKQQKNVRYYISNRGSSFIKNYQKGTTEVINKGYQVSIFNKFIEKDWEKYDLNYNFYIKECYKEIDNIIDKQLELF